ncbi:MAG: FAD-dependent oxidoreductase, partial [Bacteroidota bacterium]
GLIKGANLLVDYIEDHGGNVLMRKPVDKVSYKDGFYEVESLYRGEKELYTAERLISAIPLNNTLKIFGGPKVERKHKKKLMKSSQLNSAFTMGIVFPRKKEFDCIHYQIHLKKPLPQIGSHSIFLSISHPDDRLRCGPNEYVASISTHIPDPLNHVIEDKSEIEAAIITALSEHGFFEAEKVIFSHSSTAGAWEKWTARSWGFVGGYPQYMSIKPWQMMDARLDHKRAYICGDSTYPGQGIPGACLSGIIAYEKITLDQKKPLENLGLVRKSL